MEHNEVKCDEESKLAINLFLPGLTDFQRKGFIFMNEVKQK
jgi:hypothetical protein